MWSPTRVHCLSKVHTQQASAPLACAAACTTTSRCDQPGDRWITAASKPCACRSPACRRPATGRCLSQRARIGYPSSPYHELMPAVALTCHLQALRVPEARGQGLTARYRPRAPPSVAPLKCAKRQADGCRRHRRRTAGQRRQPPSSQARYRGRRRSRRGWRPARRW